MGALDRDQIDQENTDLGSPDLQLNDGPVAGSSWVVFGGSVEARASPGAIVVDGAGSIYVAGNYDGGSIKLGTTALPSAKDAVPLVAKLSSSGKVLWAKALTKGASDCASYGISVDGSGNIYLTGKFYDTPTLGSTTLIDTGKGDGWAAKLDKTGKVLWALSFGGTTEDLGTSIATDSMGNSYILGSFGYGGLFTIGSTALLSSGKREMFVAKLSTAGKVLWAVSAGGAEHDFPSEIALDATGGPRIAGRILGAASFGTINVTPKTSWNAFVARLDASGKFLWVAHGGSDSFIDLVGLDVDSAGDSHITGQFNDKATFGTTVLTAPLPTSSTASYVVKLSSTGTFVWGTSGGQTSKGSWRPRDISATSSGTRYLTGDFGGQVTFGSSTLTALGKTDIFVARLDAIGKWQSAVSAGGKLWDKGNRIDVDGAGSVYTAGSILYDGFDPTAVNTDTLTFGKQQHTIKGKQHLFVWKVPASAL